MGQENRYAVSSLLALKRFAAKVRQTLWCIGMLLFPLLVYSAEHWDITDTGQPYKDVRIDLNEGTWMSVDVSPDGKTLLFDLLGDLYSLPAEGGVATLVKGGPALQQQPRFSPDGQHILYISDRSGSDNAWVARADGSDARQLTNETTSLVSRPAWGPRGDSIVATKYSARHGSSLAPEVWLYHRHGGAGKALVRKGSDFKSGDEAQLSSDGRYLYYTAGHSNMFGASTVFSIQRIDLKSGEKSTVVDGYGGATTAQLSPDGKQLAFVRRVKNRTVLFVYNLQTREQTPVFDDLDRDNQVGYYQGGRYPGFDWFPDGQHIAIWGKGKLMKVNVATASHQTIPFVANTRHRITERLHYKHEADQNTFSARAIQHIAVSPDGKRLLFRALGKVWQKTLPEAKPERLTRSAAVEHDPIWSPDGRYIAYVSWQDETGSELRILKANGRLHKVVARSRGLIQSPAFSADGRHLVYHIEAGNDLFGYRGRPGIYSVSVRGGEPLRVAAQGRTPRFSADGTRIYYNVGEGIVQPGNKLESVRLDGVDRREHAFGVNLSEIHLSPDERWLVFRQYKKYYLMPYQETGGLLTIDRTQPHFPIVPLGNRAGYALTWSQYSKRLYWSLADQVFSATLPDPALSSEPEFDPQVIDIDLQVSTDRPAGMLALVGGRVISMKGDEVLDSATVLIEGSRIAAVGRSDRVTVPPQAKVIDVSGKTLMPGLIDMHGHMTLFRAGPNPQQHPSHYAALAFGVTSNFDPSTLDLPSYALAEKQRAGEMIGPRHETVGRIVLGTNDAMVSGGFEPLLSFQDAEAIVARKQALGSRLLKSYLLPRREQRQKIIKAARAAKMMVTAEADRLPYNMISMILDGHTTLEHNIPYANYYDDIVQLMAQAGTAITPTLVLTGGELPGETYMYATTNPGEHPKVKRYVPNTARIGAVASDPAYVGSMIHTQADDAIWDIGFRSVARSLAKLDQAGVVVNAGSHGQIQGLGMHWEMWLLAEGGMSYHHVLRTATLNGAKTLGLESQLGSIEVGKLADIIVLDRNPLDDICHTDSVRYTLINGRLYDANSMDEIGQQPRPRGLFYWERPDYKGIDWNESWGGLDKSARQDMGHHP